MMFTLVLMSCACEVKFTSQRDTASQEIQILLLPINISVIIFNKIYVFKVWVSVAIDS